LGFLDSAHVAERSPEIWDAVIAAPACASLRGDNGELQATGMRRPLKKLNAVGTTAVTNRPTPLQLADQG
jgi:hypothetical protein